MASIVVPPVKLSRSEAADYLGTTAGTLATWASLGKGPKFVKIGSKVVYLQRHLDEYMDSRATNCTSSIPGK